MSALPRLPIYTGSRRLAFACALLTGTAHAQQVPARAAAAGTAAGLSLQSVAGRVLEDGPDVQSARTRVEGSRGAMYAAAGAFDMQRRLSIAADQSRMVTSDPSALNASSRTGTLEYSLGIERMLRSGVVLQPRVSVNRESSPGGPGTALSVASVTLGMRAPLVRARGGGLATATERAAERDLDAAELELRHQAAISVFDVVVAYWVYVGAQSELEERRRSEVRAIKLVEDTRALVGADQRPAGDLVQLRANLAARAAARVRVEQNVIEAREQMRQLMGAADSDSALLLPPTTPLPHPGVGDDPSAESLGDVVRATLQRRNDLAAARARRGATRQLVAGATNELRPRLDLSAEVGYSGVDRGLQFGRLFTPLYRNVPGVSASVFLTYDLPRGNTLARGVALQGDAADRRAAIAVANLERTIASDVLVSIEGLTRSAHAYRRSHEAVQLYLQALESERIKFRLGSSTIFEVLQTEDALIAAQLAEINARVRYATAAVRLQFVKGTLVTHATDRLELNLDVPR